MNNKKTIKVAFSNFHPFRDGFSIGYDPSLYGSSLYTILSKNYNLEISDNPDYVFVAPYFYEPIPHPEAVRIFFSYENFFPDYNIFDFAITDICDLSYMNRHFFLDANCFYAQQAANNHDLALIKHEDVDIVIKEKTDFCSFTVSNFNGVKERENFFHSLSKYKKVLSGGGYLNNVGGAVSDKIEFARKCKFAITFENSYGLVTEKIQDAFAAKTIPIYWGCKEVTKIYNHKAFINCHDYENFEAVIEKVKQIDEDDELYYEMLSQPAFLDPYPSSYYYSTLEKYLDYIISLPKNEAINYRVQGRHHLTAERIISRGTEVVIDEDNRKHKDYLKSLSLYERICVKYYNTPVMNFLVKIKHKLFK